MNRLIQYSFKSTYWTQLFGVYFMFSPIQGFEDALSSLIKDVKNIECEHNRMEDMFNKYILFTE